MSTKKIEPSQEEKELATSENKHATELQKYGTDIIRATVATGEIYRQLVTYIRTNNVAPKLVSHELGQLGFEPSRISEVNTIANAADDVYNAFAARTIGFRRALSLHRNPVQELLADSVEATVFEVAAEVDKLEGHKEASSTSGDPKEEAIRKFNAACKAVLKHAENTKMKRKVIGIGNGYELVIQKSMKKPVPSVPPVHS